MCLQLDETKDETGWPMKIHPLYWYNISLTNKTDKPIYVDKSKCFRQPSFGATHCYAQPQESKMSSHNIERILEVLAHSTVPLCQKKYIWEERGYVEHPEDFTLNLYPMLQTPISYSPEFLNVAGVPQIAQGISPHFISIYGTDLSGDVKTYSEYNTPLSVSYYITYSKDKDLNQTSMLSAKFYIAQWVPLDGKGMQWPTVLDDRRTIVVLYGNGWTSKAGKSIPKKYINGYTNRTIISPVGYHKVKNYKGDLNELLQTAEQHFQSEDYENASSEYLTYAVNQYPRTGKQCLRAGLSCLKTNKKDGALKFFTACFKYEDLDEKVLEGLIPVIENLEGEIETQRIKDEEEAQRQEELTNAIMAAVNNLTSSITNIVSTQQSSRSSNSKYHQSLNMRSYAKTGTMRTTSSAVVSSHDDDDDDSGIGNGTVKCHECGGSGKCRPSGTVEARTTRCGGSGKCPMCYGKGRTHTKCAKCKGEGCSKCDDTGYTECTGCHGSGDCNHCSGSGNCPRCNGTGKE